MICKSNNFLTTLTQQQILYDSPAYTRPPICLASQKAVAAYPIWHSVLKNESLVLPAVEKNCGLVTTHPRFIRRLLSQSLSSPPVSCLSFSAPYFCILCSGTFCPFTWQLFLFAALYRSTSLPFVVLFVGFVSGFALVYWLGSYAACELTVHSLVIVFAFPKTNFALVRSLLVIWVARIGEGLCKLSVAGQLRSHSFTSH